LWCVYGKIATTGGYYMKNTNESKRERFIRIAEARTNKIINMTKLLSNCSNRKVYDYSIEDIEKIFSAIEKEIRLAKQRFNNTEERENRFSLN